jgi:hypothetical protein
MHMQVLVQMGLAGDPQHYWVVIASGNTSPFARKLVHRLSRLVPLVPVLGRWSSYALCILHAPPGDTQMHRLQADPSQDACFCRSLGGYGQEWPGLCAQHTGPLLRLILDRGGS